MGAAVFVAAFRSDCWRGTDAGTELVEVGAGRAPVAPTAAEKGGFAVLDRDALDKRDGMRGAERRAS